MIPRYHLLAEHLRVELAAFAGFLTELSTADEET